MRRIEEVWCTDQAVVDCSRPPPAKAKFPHPQAPKHNGVENLFHIHHQANFDKGFSIFDILTSFSPT